MEKKLELSDDLTIAPLKQSYETVTGVVPTMYPCLYTLIAFLVQKPTKFKAVIVRNYNQRIIPKLHAHLHSKQKHLQSVKPNGGKL